MCPRAAGAIYYDVGCIYNGKSVAASFSPLISYMCSAEACVRAHSSTSSGRQRTSQKSFVFGNFIAI